MAREAIVTSHERLRKNDDSCRNGQMENPRGNGRRNRRGPLYIVTNSQRCGSRRGSLAGFFQNVGGYAAVQHHLLGDLEILNLFVAGQVIHKVKH